MKDINNQFEYYKEVELFETGELNVKDLGIVEVINVLNLIYSKLTELTNYNVITAVQTPQSVTNVSGNINVSNNLVVNSYVTTTHTPPIDNYVITTTQSDSELNILLNETRLRSSLYTISVDTYDDNYIYYIEYLDRYNFCKRAISRSSNWVDFLISIRTERKLLYC